MAGFGTQFGTLEFGIEVFGSSPFSPVEQHIYVENQSPAPFQQNVVASSTIAFDLNTNILFDEASLLSILVNGVVAYQNSTPQNGYVVTKTTLPTPYDRRFSIQSPTPFPYMAEIPIFVSVQGFLSVTWSFYTADKSDCFIGPLNAFEDSLLSSFSLASTKLYYTERLRVLLLDAVSNRIDPVKAIRQVFLRAHSTELAPILRGIVPKPTSTEKLARLCYKRTAIEIHKRLQQHVGLLQACLAELRSIGLPQKHSELFHTYLYTEQPNDVVALACVIVCMGKALEVNELVIV